MKHTFSGLTAIVAAFAILAIAQPSRAQETGSWSDKTLGQETYFHGVVGYGGCLYAFGGAADINTGTRRFNPVTNAWTDDLALLPATAYGFSVAEFQGVCYLFGNWAGHEGDGARIYAYDIVQNSWRLVNASLSTPRALSVAVAVGSKIYICGGIDTLSYALLADVDEFDTVTETVTPRAPLPVASLGAVGGAIRGLVYYAGGYSDSVSQEMYSYDPANDTWTRRAQLPRAECYLATSFVLQDTLTVIGGFSFENGYSGAVIEYYPDNDSWVEGPALTDDNGLIMSAACVVNGKGYVYGGEFFNATTNTYRYDLTLEYVPPTAIGGESTTLESVPAGPSSGCSHSASPQGSFTAVVLLIMLVVGASFRTQIR